MVTISMSELEFDTLLRVVQKARKFQATRADPERSSTPAARTYAEQERDRLDSLLNSLTYKQVIDPD
jgi:hypothetical protein